MSLTRAAFDRVVQTDPAALYALFQQQAAPLAAVTARVQHLEARLGGHRQHSHLCWLVGSSVATVQLRMS